MVTSLHSHPEGLSEIMDHGPLHRLENTLFKALHIKFLTHIIFKCILILYKYTSMHICEIRSPCQYYYAKFGGINKILAKSCFDLMLHNKQFRAN